MSFPAFTMLAAAPAALVESTNTLTLRSDLPDVGASAIRALAGLAIVLAIFFAGVWLFRNGQRFSLRRTGHSKLAILESRALGNRFAIYVVGYEQQRLLIGSSPAGINLLTQLPPATETTVASDPLPPPAESFARKLQEMIKGT